MRGASVAAFLAAILWAGAGEAEPAGAPLYGEHCLTCHQADGYGVPFQQPALAESEIVLGESTALIQYVLAGTEFSEPGTSEWGNVMPGFPQLSDRELAAVLTYIRQSFGNAADAVSEQDVRGARKR